MTARIVVAVPGQAVAAGDARGLNYGDGLFETVRVHAGRPVRWDAHWARLARGADVLGFALPAADAVLAEAMSLFPAAGEGVLKIVATRGSGGRGYAAPATPEPLLLLSRHPLPAPAPAEIVLRWCDLRIAIQPRLAGLKHLNRLEQVLARAEWDHPAIFEGLLLDTEGRVVGATAANVFARIDGQWRTPPVERCGVAGTLRAWCLETLPALEFELTPDAVENADALFVCNAVRGILQVHRLGARRWPADAAIAALRRKLAAAEPAFTSE
jgi:4-amino-4-deoxychorismate lyase